MVLRAVVQALQLHQHGVLAAAMRAAGGGHVCVVLRAGDAVAGEAEALVHRGGEREREPAGGVHRGGRHTCTPLVLFPLR